MEDKNTITYMKDVQVDVDNNCHLFKNGIDYALAKFMQASKMSQ